MIFTTTPKTIALANFRKSLLGSWIDFLENDPLIKDLTFAPDNLPLRVTPLYLPDREEEFKLPSIIIHRLKEEFMIGRNGNHYQTITQQIDGIDKVTQVMGLRLRGMYQLDVVTRDLHSQSIITGYVDNKLLGMDKYDDYGNILEGIKTPTVKFFTVKDISKRTSLSQPISELPDTDVKVLWRPYNVQFVESFIGDKTIEQVSYTIEFWCDLWYSEHEDKIMSIGVDTTILENINE